MQGSVEPQGLDDVSRLFTSTEVARIFRVDPKTVNRWAKAGKLTAILTPGGSRRFRADEICARLAEDEDDLAV
jgi:excisionase family DNA binding protein